MQKSAELPKMHVDHFSTGNSTDFACDKCGGTFQNPILATISCSGKVQTYYACPRCMTRINKEHTETTKSKSVIKKPSVKLENAQCRHSLGYLKKRPKNTPIPDECLTCRKMIECMLS